MANYDNLVRSFIAFEIPETIKESIKNNLKNLRSETSLFKWVESENLHLTIVFMGNTAENILEVLASHLKSKLASFPPFEFSIRGFGMFPNSKKPRIFWVGAEPSNKFENIHSIVSATLKSLGAAFDDRKTFSPHITVARAREIRPVDEKLFFEFKDLCYGSFRCDSISIMKSILTQKGSIYKTLYKINLGGNSNG